LIKSRFHNLLEQLFVAAKLLRIIACHADNGAFYFGRRVEYEDTLFNKRPEQLSVEEFIDLTNKVEIALKEMNLQP